MAFGIGFSPAPGLHNQAQQFRALAAQQQQMNMNSSYGYGENVNFSPRARMEAVYDRSYQNWNSLAYQRPQQAANYEFTGNAQQATQQFNGTYGGMQQQEGQMYSEACQQYGALKEDIFASNHYQFGQDGRPQLVRGKESPRDKVARMTYERRQNMAVERQMANHPLQGRIRQLEQQAQLALQSGQNPTQALLDLDAAKTRLSLDKANALMNATMPPEGGSADDSVRALREFGNGALNDYQNLHQENMQRLAADPATQAYLQSVGQQQRQNSAYMTEMRRRGQMNYQGGY